MSCNMLMSKEAKQAKSMLTPLLMATNYSGGRWRPAEHLKVIDEAIVKAICGEGPRLLVIEAPPRHGKSQLVSHWLPIWYLSIFPDRKVMLASYETTFARSWGRKARDAFQSFSHLTGYTVDPAHASAGEWGVHKHGGGMKTAGAGGPLTGEGTTCLIIDDPLKNAEQALSPTIRDGLWDWWQTTASTRIEPGGIAIVMATRWHPEDLSGRLLAEAEAGNGEPVRHIHLPAIAEDGDILGRKPGEALWPSQWPVEHLEQRREAMGTFWWRALYQQSPGVSK